MNLRWHSPVSLCALLFAFLLASNSPAEEPGSNYVTDPAIEQAINDALSADKAVAYPAIKKLSEFGGSARRALDHRLFNEKVQRTRVQISEILARACEGRVAYRITLEMSPDGSGKLRLESDRTMLAECARKYDRILGNPPTVYPDDELRRNPYGKGDLAKHMETGMKYVQGESITRDGRILASGELSFSNFDEFAAFATSFDRSGYHMLNGITLNDNNNLRVLHFKKNPDQNTAAARYLLLFHDVKWEFVLDFKGVIQSTNATSMARTKHVWTFNCAQMLTGEAEIEASFDPRQAPSNTGAVAQPSTPGNSGASSPVAVVAQNTLSLLTGKRDENGVPVTRGPDYEVTLDGRPSTPAGPDLRYQWMQTSGIPLNLPKDRIAIPVVKMLIYQAGEYRFELTVSKGDKTSAPVEVLVLVGDGVKPDLASVNRTAKVVSQNGGGTQRVTEFDFGKAPAASTNDSTGFKAGTAQPVTAPSINTNKIVASIPVNTSASKIDLSLIRQVEDEYARNLSAGGSTHQILVPNSLASAAQNTPPANIKITPPIPVPPVANVDSVRTPALNKSELPPAPPIPAIPPIPLNNQPNELVALNKTSLEEIRRAEDQFIKKNETKTTPPINPPESIQKIQPVEVKPVEVKPVELKPVDVKPVEIKTPEVKPVVPPAITTEVKKEIKPLDTKQDLKEFENALKEVGNVKPVAVQPVPIVPVEQPAKTTPDITAKVTPPPVPPTTAIATTPATPVKAGETLAEGIAFIKSAQYASAVETLKRAHAAKPDEETKVQLGIAILNLAEKPNSYDLPRTMDAALQFEEVIAKNPKNITALMYYGHANARMDKMPQASKIYREGGKLGGDAVKWETMWQLGNKSNKVKDYNMALTMLKDAEATALKANVKDARLERDFAVAYHGLNQDAEAVKRAQNVLALGYALDPQLAAELKIDVNAVPAAPVETALKPVTPEPVKPTEVAIVKPVPSTVVEAVKPETSNVVDTRTEMEKRFDALLKDKEQGKTPATANTVKPVEPAPPIEALKPVVAAKETPAAVPPVPVNSVKPPAAVPPVQGVAALGTTPAPKPATPAAPVESIQDLEKRANEIMSIKPVAPPDKPSKVLTPPAKPREVKKLPPVPDRFDAALAAGKRALERGQKLLAQNTDDSKAQARDAWEESEAMLRGAWNLRASGKESDVVETFTELSKHIGAIALVTNQNLIAKKNGLVVLNAEPSIIYPAGKALFYAWEQVGGPDLDLRRENLATKKLGLRIKEPGVYKFELVVSDGARGGNPVTVSVEVQENRGQ